MNKVVQLPVVELHKLLASANETGRLQPLLDAIKLACQEKANVAPIVQAWNAGKQKLKPVSFDEFALFLQEFEFDLPTAWVKPETDDREVSDAIKACHAAGQALVREAEELGKRMDASPEFQKMLADYGDFRPARQLAHLLPKFFENEDPGKVIGRYMGLLYGAPSEAPLPEFSRYQVTDKSLADAIMEIGLACIKAAKSHSADMRQHFARALNYIILSREDETGFDYITDPAPFFAAVDAVPISLALKLLWRWGDPAYYVDTDRRVNTNRLFAVLLNRIGTAPSTDKASDRRLPFAAADLICVRINDEFLIAYNGLDSIFVKAVVALLDRARVFARRNLAGCSPFSADTMFWFSRIKSDIDWKCNDLRLELAYALEEAWATDLDVWDSFEDGDAPMDLRARCDTYIELFDACAEEGFQHLASAVLAFFVFSQAVAHDGKLGAWLEIAKRVEQSADYAGREMVEQALRIAEELAHKSAPLTALAIQSSIKNTQKPPISNVLDISIVHAAKQTGRAEFEEQWKAHLGLLRWNKLSANCQALLVDGDLKWSLIFRVFCRGLKNWGGVGIDYAQAIEVELSIRLKWLPDSQLFRKSFEDAGRKPDTNLTFGTLLKTLKDSRNPQNQQLRTEIENAGVQCQNNGELMKQLHTLVKLRNDAAHSNAFGPKQYTEMKELIFVMMPAFVDSLG